MADIKAPSASPATPYGCPAKGPRRPSCCAGPANSPSYRPCCC
ncbi:hypothetical protein ACFQ0Q_41155 [Streptomyces aureus]